MTSRYWYEEGDPPVEGVDTAVIGEGDGLEAVFTFDRYSLAGKSYTVYVDGIEQTEAVVDEATGQITLAEAANIGERVEVRVHDVDNMDVGVEK